MGERSFLVNYSEKTYFDRLEPISTEEQNHPQQNITLLRL